jgi:hypothetical protein
MREDVQPKQPLERPLSTAALAHADHPTTAENRAQDRYDDRRPDPALREADRPAADGGPTLVPPASHALRPSPEQRHSQHGAAVAEKSEAVNEDEKAGPLFSEQASKDFLARWDSLQVGFIDEPRRAVEQADHLVAAVMKRLAEMFAEERARLEGQWDRGDSVSTEDLRISLRRYRSFFRRLLAI